MTPSLNVNVDPSNAPSWLLVLLLAATLAAEVLDHIDTQPTGISVEECHALCDGQVGAWNPYECRCQGQ